MANLAKPVPLIGAPDDAALFESIDNPQASLPTEAEAQPEPSTAAEAKAAEDAEEAAGDPPEAVEQPRQRGTRIPLSEHLAEREKRQAAEARAAALEAKQADRDRDFQALQRQIADLQRPKAAEPAAPTDFWENPEQSVEQRVQKAVEALKRDQLVNARLIADQLHTQATVKAAADAFDAMSASGQIDPTDQRRIATSPNPFHEAVLWNKRRTALAEVGDDLGAFKSKLRDEALKDPEFRKAAMAAWREEAVANANAGQPAGTNLPSLNRATGAGSAASESQRWKSDAELFDETNQPRRRA